MKVGTEERYELASVATGAFTAPTSATIRTGEPLPPPIFRGRIVTVKSFAGNCRVKLELRGKATLV